MGRDRSAFNRMIFTVLNLGKTSCYLLSTVPWMPISLTTDDACVILSETKGLQCVILLSAQFYSQHRQEKEPDYLKVSPSHHHHPKKFEVLTQKIVLHLSHATSWNKKKTSFRINRSLFLLSLTLFKSKLFPRSQELLFYSYNLHAYQCLWRQPSVTNYTRKYSPTLGESTDIKTQGLLYDWFSCHDRLLELMCSQMHLFSRFLTLHLNHESDKERKF